MSQVERQHLNELRAILERPDRGLTEGERMTALAKLQTPDADEQIRQLRLLYGDTK